MQRRATVVQDMLKSISQGFGQKADESRAPFVADRISDVVSESLESARKDEEDLMFHKQRITELEAEVADLREVIK